MNTDIGLNFMAHSAVRILSNMKYPIKGVINNLDELICLNNGGNNSLRNIQHFKIDMDFSRTDSRLSSVNLTEQVVIPAMNELISKIGKLEGDYVSFNLGVRETCDCVVLKYKSLVLRTSYAYNMSYHRKLLVFEIVLLRIS